MSEEELGQKIRERLWITKVDKSVDPPVVVEELFVENGVIMERKTPMVPVQADPVTEDSHE